jgi:hypothetical protein
MKVADVGGILRALSAENVDFILVGGAAAVLQGSALLTADTDIVHSRAPENIQKLLNVLQQLNARYRARPDLSPSASHLGSTGHNLLMTDLGPLDVLGAIEGGRDYGDLLPHSDALIVHGRAVRMLKLDFMLMLKEQSNEPKDRNSALYLRKALEEKRRGSRCEHDPE